MSSTSSSSKQSSFTDTLLTPVVNPFGFGSDMFKQEKEKLLEFGFSIIDPETGKESYHKGFTTFRGESDRTNAIGLLSSLCNNLDLRIIEPEELGECASNSGSIFGGHLKKYYRMAVFRGCAKFVHYYSANDIMDVDRKITEMKNQNMYDDYAIVKEINILSLFGGLACLNEWKTMKKWLEESDIEFYRQKILTKFSQSCLVCWIDENPTHTQSSVQNKKKSTKRARHE